MAEPVNTEPPIAVAAGTREWRFPSIAMSVGAMRRELRPFLASSGLPDQDVDDLVLAACEAATNGIEHARFPAEPFFDVQAEISGHDVRIVVRDYGRWTVPQSMSSDRGRGLHMMTMLAAVSFTSTVMGTVGHPPQPRGRPLSLGAGALTGRPTRTAAVGRSP